MGQGHISTVVFFEYRTTLARLNTESECVSGEWPLYHMLPQMFQQLTKRAIRFLLMLFVARLKCSCSSASTHKKINKTTCATAESLPVTSY